MGQADLKGDHQSPRPMFPAQNAPAVKTGA